MSDAKVQIYGMVHSQNVLGPLMIATHYKLGELAFTNLFEDRTPEFKAMNPFNKCPVLKDGEPTSAERIQAYVDAFFAEVPCATMMKSAEGHSILEFLDGLEP